MRQIKVIHVHLTGKRKDYYFGSIAAIFQHLAPELVGCTYGYLRRAGLSGGGTVVTKRAIIKQSVLLTAKSNTSKEKSNEETLASADSSINRKQAHT